MADIERMKKALINADKAGDVEAAKKIANAIRAAQSEPVVEKYGTILPVRRDAEGLHWDWNAGIPGAVKRAVQAPGEAMRGEIPMWDANGNPSQEAMGRAMEFAGVFSPVSAGSATRMGAATVAAKPPKSSRLIAKALMRDSIDPSDVVPRLNDLGPDAMMADLGPNMTGMAGGIAARPSTGQRVIRDAIGARQKSANMRIRDALDTTIGPARTPSAVDETIRAGQKALSPLYEKVLGGAGKVDTSALAKGLDDQAGKLRGPAQSAIRSVRDMLNVTGKQELDGDPSTLLQVRQAIDGMLSSETDRNTTRVLSEARSQIDDLLKVNVPGIKDVDNMYTELARQREALERGQTVLDSGRGAPRPDELAREVSEGAIPIGNVPGPSGVPMRLSQGARAEIERLVGTKANDVVALKSLMKGEGAWNRDRLATLFGQDKADKILKVLDTESLYADTAQRVTRNSETAARLGAQEDLFGQGSGLNMKDAYTVGGTMGTLRNLGVRAAEKTGRVFNNMRSEKLLTELGEALTTNDRQKINSIMGVISRRDPSLTRKAMAMMLSRPENYRRVQNDLQSRIRDALVTGPQ